MTKTSGENWAELDTASNKHEIKYSGQSFNEKLEKSVGLLPKNLFVLTSINFLELSHSILNEIPSEIGNLKELTNLVLRSNQLKSLPSTLGDLSKLKYLDVSYNQIEEIPSEISACQELQTLNVCHNKIVEFSSEFTNLVHLAHLDCSFNEFSSFPSSICDENLQHLAEINFKSNKIQSIPVEIRRLHSLKILNLQENQIEVVPGELSDCTKLKEIHFENNKLSDKRLAKLISQCQQKSILDYVKKNCPKLAVVVPKNVKNTSKDDRKKSAKNANSSKNDVDDDENEPSKDKIIILPSSEEFRINVADSVADVRPFLLCCVLKNLHFPDQKTMKKFIALQSKIHDEECKKRTAATIATHDLNKILDPVTYVAKIPQEISILPLMRQKECSAEELMNKLTEEAENLRKEKKRNVYSGIHQYLYLLKDKPKYPCLIDRDNRVISFPPITNSDLTKISDETKDILIEVTSSVNLPTCKRVMEILIKQILNLGLNQSETLEDGQAEKKNKILTIQQVKIFSANEQLKTTFPSKSDLMFDDIEIVRDWMKNED